MVPSRMPKQKHNDRRESKATFVESRKDRIVYRMVSKKSRKRCLIFGSYFAVLAVGVILGLIPFILQYISDVEADREALRMFVKQQERLFNLTAKNPATLALSSEPKKIIETKTGSAHGNESILLTCRGKISIVSIRWNDVTAGLSTINQFREYCKKNAKVLEDKRNFCVVSMEEVFNFKHTSPKSFTQIDYRCEEIVQF